MLVKWILSVQFSGYWEGFIFGVGGCKEDRIRRSKVEGRDGPKGKNLCIDCLGRKKYSERQLRWKHENSIAKCHFLKGSNCTPTFIAA